MHTSHETRYRVAWTEIGNEDSSGFSPDGETEKEEIFDRMDLGWDRYQYIQEQQWARTAVWEHFTASQGRSG